MSWALTTGLACTGPTAIRESRRRTDEGVRNMRELLSRQLGPTIRVRGSEGFQLVSDPRIGWSCSCCRGSLFSYE
ncbi:hypothetical protein NDU88_006021 [Pleurodeles waltl]|uniref:Uncharacterized protein n=1 Tax=Pleurodeles waltl TaxID=8319 RepID=A0AAV7PQ92_PLEWA|nr:hypothetical protein NDU88_006021 [Pleurodeles waltl]